MRSTITLILLVIIALTGSLSAQQAIVDEWRELSTTCSFNSDIGSQELNIDLRDYPSSLQKSFPNNIDYLIDSVVYYRYPSEGDSVRVHKFIDKYNEQGFLTELTRFDWDEETEKWINVYKYEHYPINEFDRDSTIGFGWDIDVGNWVPQTKHIYGFDENGFDNKHESYYWNTEINRWDKSTKYIFLNDNDGNVLEAKIWTDDANNEWELDRRDDYTYDDNQKLLFIHQYLWESGMWVPYVKWEYFYHTSSGLLDWRIEYIWEDSVWKETRKVEFTYNDQDELILRTNYIKDNESWMNESKSEYAYNENGQEILEIESEWDEINERWILDSKTESDFNQEGFWILYAYYKWSEETEDWEGIFMREYIYNDEGDLHIIYRYDWEEESAVWILDEKGFYYYSLFTSIGDTYSTNLLVYPNPFTDRIHITGTTSVQSRIAVLTINGKLLIEKQISGSSTSMNLKELPEGIYLLKIYDGSSIVSKKIIKR